jgi:hypothetical protein
MIRLRISTDGRIRGLWSDAVDLTALGPTSVRRASHVEFNRRWQRWTVRPAPRMGLLHRVLASVLRGRRSDVIYSSRTRDAALRWEQVHFRPGGAGWDHDIDRQAPHEEPRENPGWG